MKFNPYFLLRKRPAGPPMDSRPAGERSSRPKALGVLLCYNDADILPDAIEAMLRNNHNIIVWDHGSDDNTAQVLDSYASHFVERKHIPRDFDFYKLHGEMSLHLQRHYCRHYDWISWPDQDEILEGPTREKSYYDWITEVFNSRYNWVQFRNFNFWFTSEDEASIVAPTQRIRRYCLFPDCPPRIRAWRASVTNVRAFNHNPLDGFPYPRPFNLRHYPMRSREQMLKRLHKDRAGIQRHGNNWHYDNMRRDVERLIIAPQQLHRDDGHSELNPEPVFDWRSIYGHGPGTPPPVQNAAPRSRSLKFLAQILAPRSRRSGGILRPDPVFIVGMHRSGTSVLAGLLESLGLSVGTTVMPPNAENPRGFYENQAVADLHDRFFAEVGRSWLDPRPMDPAQFAGRAAGRFRKDLLPLLMEEFRQARPLIKDPRLCQLLPLWLPLIKTVFPQSRFALPIRHPLEVACSLRKRHHVTLSRGLALWTIHVLEAERATRGFARVFSTYDQLLRSPVETLGQVVQSLGLPAPAISAAVEHHVDLTLRHHSEEPWPAQEPHADLILAIHKTLVLHQTDMERALDGFRSEYYRRLETSPPLFQSGTPAMF